ncbi:MAG: OB-fold domain-containing protein [Bryobacteraceae bacterium]|nr:OB-fold domain-containing protein [Bryobacteraceae bacterium]
MAQEEGPGPGVVYTETVVHAAPEAYVNEAPYQIAILTLDRGGRITARIEGERVSIGDRVAFKEFRNGIPVYTKSP